MNVGSDWKPGSDGYVKKAKELRVKKFELEQEQESLQDEFERKVAKSLTQIACGRSCSGRART